MRMPLRPMRRLGSHCSGGSLQSGIRASVSSSIALFAPSAASNNNSSKSDALTDTLGRFHNYLRISLTERCNLRCMYCMPEKGVSLTPSAKLLTLDERKRLIDIFAGLGVSKLRFTGGEPTVSKQLVDLVQHARSTGNIQSIGITTNGLTLKSRPPRVIGVDNSSSSGDQQTLLEALIASGLTNVNISLDTLNEDRFATITRRDRTGLAKTLSAIYYAVSKLSATSGGLRSVKVNCVLMRGINDSEVSSFVGLARELPIDVRFIELMPFNGNLWEKEKFVPYTEIMERLHSEHGVQLSKWTPSSSGSGHVVDRSDTTKWYSLPGGAPGRVGFITSMTSHFCSSCNRLRVTADGHLKVCLFGADNLDLLSLLRTGGEGGNQASSPRETIEECIRGAVLQKKPALGGFGTAGSGGFNHRLADSAGANRPMILIGG